MKNLSIRFRITHACDTLNDQIGLSQRACLIKAADVDFASEGNAPWLCAENLRLHKLDNRVVDCD